MTATQDTLRYVVICFLILIFEVLITACTQMFMQRHLVVICFLILIFEVLITAGGIQTKDRMPL